MDGAQFSNINEINNAGDIVGGDKIVQLPPPEVIQRLHQLPPPPADFVGRAAQLNELRGHATHGAVISGVHGLGGIGKTALALQFAAGLRDQYPDAQFFLDLRGASQTPVTPVEALAHVIRAYHPESKLPDDEAQLRALYLSVLAGQRALLVFDNARDLAQVARLTPPASCYLLITARQEFALPGQRAVHLEQLSGEEARALLRAIVTRLSVNDAKADDLARVCGYLPLAVRAAASALQANRALTPAKLLERLNDQQRRLQLEGLKTEGVPITVAGCFALSYDLLPPDLQSAWRALAVFTARFDDAAAQTVCALPSPEPLEELARWNLVEYDPAESRYYLHDLARLYAASCQTPEEQLAVGERHVEHFLELLEECQQLYTQGGEAMLNGLARFDAHRAHIEAGQAWAARRYQALTARQTTEALEIAAQFCNRYAWQGDLLYDRFHPRQRIEWMQVGLSAARHLKHKQAEGAHLDNLGLAYAALSEPRRAIEFYEQALVIARAIGDRRGEEAALGNLGLAYAALSEPRRAIEFHEQALVIARVLGDRRSEGAALNNLGIAYKDLGEPRRAIEFYEQHLVIARALGDRRGEGNAFGCLGAAYADLGEPRRALEFYEQYLAIARALGDRRGEGHALGNLGAAYADLGEPRRALEFHEQALAIARVLGDRRGEGNVLVNLGSAYLDLGDYAKAREFYQQQMPIAQAVGDRRGEGSAWWGLALCYEKDHDLPNALKCAETALAIFTAIESPSAKEMQALVERLRG